MGAFSRVIGIFFEPKKTFADIAQWPSWIVPMILVILAAVGFTVAIGQRIGWQQVIRHQMETSTAMQQLPPEQREQSIALQTKIASVTAYIGPVIGVPLYDVIAAAILLGITALMGGGLRFKQVFAVVCYGGLPGVISALLKTAVVFLKNPEDFAMENPLPFFNLGAFMNPNTSSKFAYAFASSMDLFAIWTILLLATGLKVAAGKRLTFAGALIAVLVPFFLLVLVGAGLATLR
jgi:hypothetical protein